MILDPMHARRIVFSRTVNLQAVLYFLTLKYII